MATATQIAALVTVYHAAKAAIPLTADILTISLEDWARAVSCEAMNETGWLTAMPPRSFNCLGIKAFKGYTGPVVAANGTEQEADGSFTGPEHDLWRVYPNYTACLLDQLHILQHQHDANGALHYQAALKAGDVEGYIKAECFAWSTELSKGISVLATYLAHKDLLV